MSLFERDRNVLLLEEHAVIGEILNKMKTERFDFEVGFTAIEYMIKQISESENWPPETVGLLKQIICYNILEETRSEDSLKPAGLQLAKLISKRPDINKWEKIIVSPNNKAFPNFRFAVENNAGRDIGILNAEDASITKIQ